MKWSIVLVLTFFSMVWSVVAIFQEEAGRPFEEVPLAKVLDGGKDKNAVGDTDALWGFFYTVSQAEKTHPGMGTTILERSVGLSSEKAEHVRDFILLTLNEYNRFSRELFLESCDNADLLISQGLGKAIATIEEKEKNQKEKYLTSDLRKILTPAEYSLLVSWVNRELKGNMHVISLDFENAYSSFPDNMKENFKKGCNEMKMSVQKAD